MIATFVHTPFLRSKQTVTKKIYGYLSSAEKESLLETLLDKLD